MFGQNWKLILEPEITDPALNLALEEWAVRRLTPEYSYLFMYVNRPAVVLGHHQNVLQEVNVRACWQENIPILRRISGGGTVVHDEGNLNIAFITEHTLRNFNQYRNFLQPIVRTLQRLGVPVEPDEHNNLHIRGKKISGNAQFSSRGRLLSHGTLLFNSDLSRLKKLLQVPDNRLIKSRATRSKPAPITNLRPYLGQKLTLKDLRSMLIKAFLGDSPRRVSFGNSEWSEIKTLAEEKYRDFDWNVGQSPESEVVITIATPDDQALSLKYSFEEGRFKNVFISDQRLRFLQSLMEGQPLKKETFGRLQREIDELADPLLKEKAQRIFNLWI